MSASIFVSIAAYRDRDCANTIADLFAKARWPDRVFVGLCWQYKRPGDEDIRPVPERPSQCRVIAVTIDQSSGVCWARHQVQRLWRGEDYVLQIDSHSRFVAGWDEKMLEMLARCGAAKPILSNYPAAFTPPDLIESHVVSVIHASGFDDDGMLKLKSIGHAPGVMGTKPRPTALCAGGFLFGRSAWILEVPYDPHLYFLGEESSLAVRLYTHGFDLFTPNDVLLYHDYNDHSDRPRHWRDRVDWPSINDRALRRVRHLLGMESARDPDVLREIDRYGLGQARSLDDWQKFAGINFRQRKVG